MNESLFLFFYNLAHRSEVVDKVIIFSAVYLPYLVIIAAGVFLLMHHDAFKAESTWQVFIEKKKEILMVFFSGVVAWIVATILKFVFATPRPAILFEGLNPLIHQSGFSFPSQHTVFFAALAFEIFMIHKKAGFVFLLLALAIGLARIAAGVHFPVDILGGFIFGFLVAFLVNKFRRRVV